MLVFMENLTNKVFFVIANFKVPDICGFEE